MPETEWFGMYSGWHCTLVRSHAAEKSFVESSGITSMTHTHTHTRTHSNSHPSGGGRGGGRVEGGESPRTALPPGGPAAMAQRCRRGRRAALLDLLRVRELRGAGAGAVGDVQASPSLSPPPPPAPLPNHERCNLLSAADPPTESLDGTLATTDGASGPVRCVLRRSLVDGALV